MKETERFSFRLLILQDAAQLADYYQRNQDFHRPWSPPLTARFATLAFQEQRLRKYLEKHDRGEEYRFGIFANTINAEPSIAKTSLLIGSINLTTVERAPFQNGRLGYSMDARYTNRGILSTYLKEVIKYAFGTLGLHRLEANIMPRNAASRRVLQKCGFQKIGYSPKYLNIQGVWEDHEMYMVLAEE
jgi:[ribosomal protein S5]-alanine N-acetyltransferase